MTFETLCLLRRDAARVNAAALLASLQRERFAKDAREQSGLASGSSRHIARRAPYSPEDYATHCRRGHRLAGDNLYLHPGGARLCRACRSLGRERRGKR